MNFAELFKKKKTVITETKTTTIVTEEKTTTEEQKQKPFEKVAPEKIGVLDMVIAFDTTGSMAATPLPGPVSRWRHTLMLFAMRWQSWYLVSLRTTKT
mgnify:CR=1 FL=1